MKVDLSCPIELWEYSLPTEGAPACFFTFFNLDERPISSIQITVTCYDEKDDIISRRVERPMALDAEGRRPFRVELPTKEMDVEAIDLSIDKAWYEDGSEWRRVQEARLVEYQPNELPPNRKLEQLRYVAGQDAIGYPSDQKNVWICVCGRVNATEEWCCRRCERDKAEVFERFSYDAVQEAIDQREKELEEKAKLAREEASRKEFLRQDQKRRKKRRRRLRSVILCVAVALVVFSYLFAVLGLPALKYQTALNALNTGDITHARTIFGELMEYRDAAEQVKECDLRIATEYIGSGNEEKINTAIVMLRDLGGYQGAGQMIDEATYQKGVLLMEKNDFAAASFLFSGLANYRDAEELVKESEYQIATALMTAGSYKEAAEKFTLLTNYMDAAAQAKECVYRPAIALMTEGKYEEAADMLSTIVGYSDASVQRQQAIYMSALRAQTAGDYEYASERFMLLGNYGDANEQMQHSIYLAAGAARDTGNYETAKKLYATIPAYQDAAEQEQLCVYQPAVAMIAEEQYKNAAELLELLPGYKDADELWQECIYNAAISEMDGKNYSAAIALMERLPGYQDVDDLMNAANYSRAEALEEVGQLDLAMETFEALGDYSDSAKRILAIRYIQAERLLEAKDFEDAMQAFGALGDYADAAERVKECAYDKALLLYGGDDLQGAYDALIAIESYEKAMEKMQEIAYEMGDKYFYDDNLERAAEAFEMAGNYQDAGERYKEAIYLQALEFLSDESYAQAGEMFSSIAGYRDANEKRDETYDLWLSGFLEQVKELFANKEYDELLSGYTNIDVNTLPSKYAELRTMYYEANILQARLLVNEDRPLEAYKYLVACDGYKNAKELLDKNIYKLLGTWKTSAGTEYAFFLNGVCIIDGEEYVFNMPNAYAIWTGKSKDDMVRTMSFSSATNNTLALTIDETGTKIRMDRVKQAEISPDAIVVEDELELDAGMDIEEMDDEALAEDED